MTDAARLRYLSVCSGIEAATVAWHPLGWEPAAFSEIEAFPRAVLTHHYPTVPLHGDFTTIEGDEYGTIDLLVGGTPCQDFSVAGLRAGIAGDRGNLTLEFLRLAARTKPRWIVWENVPGVLSSDDGRALGAFLGGLAELGYGFGYRVLDAQYFNLAQRRARVFVVGYLGDWRRAAAVLFERESLLGNPAPRREAGKGLAPTISARPTGGGGLGTDFDCDGGTGRGTPIVAFAQNQRDEVREMAIAGALASEPGMKQQTYVALTAKDYGADAGPISPTLRSGGHDKSHANGGVMPAVGFDTYNQSTGDINQTLQRGTGTDQIGAIIASTAVRRLTPEECEALQGFPRGYTFVPYRGKPAADGPRYKALGNSMAVPCMRWLGERIQMVEALT